MEESEEPCLLSKALEDANPKKKITKNVIVELLIETMPVEKAEMVANLIFMAFDKDKDGTIDFHDFMEATNCINTTTTTPMLEEKLHWVFQMYDKDGSDSIQLGEMVEIFSMLYLCEGIDEKLAIVRAEKVFNLLDANNDGDVTEDEFVNGCLDDADLVQELAGKSKENLRKKKKILLPRYSVSVENRCTTQRRYLNSI